MTASHDLCILLYTPHTRSRQWQQDKHIIFVMAVQSNFLPLLWVGKFATAVLSFADQITPSWERGLKRSLHPTSSIESSNRASTFQALSNTKFESGAASSETAKGNKGEQASDLGL